MVKRKIPGSSLRQNIEKQTAHESNPLSLNTPSDMNMHPQSEHGYSNPGICFIYLVSGEWIAVNLISLFGGPIFSPVDAPSLQWNVYSHPQFVQWWVETFEPFRLLFWFGAVGHLYSHRAFVQSKNKTCVHLLWDLLPMEIMPEFKVENAEGSCQLFVGNNHVPNRI